MDKPVRDSAYFLYHSIGQYPRKAEDLSAAVAEFAGSWGASDDGQWGYGLKKRQRFIDLWRKVLNAPAGTVTTSENVTSGLYSLIGALPAKTLKGKRLLVAGDCFPSVHFLLSGLASRFGFTLDTVPIRAGASWVEDEDVIARWDKDVGLALLTWVSSTSSVRCDIDRLVDHGRTMGTLIGVDITQGAGLLPFDVRQPEIDFAVSTSLKWMCGTPGAGMLYVVNRLIGQCQPELRGWFSQNNPFSWDLDKFNFAHDIRRFDNGTPGIVAAVASLPALEWHAGQDAQALVAHNRVLCERIIGHADRLGLALVSPRNDERRGGSVMLQMPDTAEAASVVGALRIEGVSADSRSRILRLSPGAVTTADGVDRLFDIAERVMKTRLRRFAGRPSQSADAAATQNETVSARHTLRSLGTMLTGGGIKVVDCTGTLGFSTPLLKLPPDLGLDTPPIEVHKISEYDENGPFWAWNWLKLGEHSGTHFDAPHHWITGRDFADGYTDTLDVQRLIAPVNVIDCSKQSADDPDFLLTADGVRAWELAHGEIGPGEWVVMRTDWDRRADSESEFLNADENGPHSPGPTPDCIDYLLSKGIVGWGSQCIGTDAGLAADMSPPFPAHTMLHRDNCFGLASLANLDQLPPRGAILIATPLKIRNGTGSPIRALALVPQG
jgi:kynurenine formamidase/selenocysteine lyase/cysteine desulfurase